MSHAEVGTLQWLRVQPSHRQEQGRLEQDPRDRTHHCWNLNQHTTLLTHWHSKQHFWNVTQDTALFTPYTLLKIVDTWHSTVTVDTIHSPHHSFHFFFFISHNTWPCWHFTHHTSLLTLDATHWTDETWHNPWHRWYFTQNMSLLTLDIALLILNTEFNNVASWHSIQQCGHLRQHC